jgi:hypothetical protein
VGLELPLANTDSIVEVFTSAASLFAELTNRCEAFLSPSQNSWQALEMGGVEKAWSLWHLSQAVAKAISMAEPYLPFFGCGLDSDPAWIRLVLRYRFATETAWAKRNVRLFRNHSHYPVSTNHC